MHGVKRTKLSKEDEDRKRTEDAQQIKQYRILVDDCLSRKAKKDYSHDAFTLTNRILDSNPEFYTIWNYRRMIMLEGLFPDATLEERYILLSSDLRLTTSYLKIHPKVYWIWTHRKWCLEHIPDGPGTKLGDGSAAAVDTLKQDSNHVNGQHNTQTSHNQNGAQKDVQSVKTQEQVHEEKDVEGWKKEAWGRELMLVEKMLEADSRNFHAWDYRRYVLSSLPRTFHPPKTPETEIKYTTKKIESNFSNFSAWHQRTKELGKIWDSLRSGEKGILVDAETEIQKMRQKEFELVTQALWTDPADQSGWLYHRWLIGNGNDLVTLQREIAQIKELLEAEPDSKWPLESLVHYNQLLLRTGALSSDEASRVRSDMQQWLRDLERIDPFRKERYRELGVELEENGIL